MVDKQKDRDIGDVQHDDLTQEASSNIETGKEVEVRPMQTQNAEATRGENEGNEKLEDRQATMDAETSGMFAKEDKEGILTAEKPEKEGIVLTMEEFEAISKKASERDDFLDKLQRSRAEYLNFQKRMNKEIEMTRQFAIQGLAMALTSILSNFARAINSSKGLKDFDKLFEGIQLVESQLYKTLEDYGIRPIETAGKPFDPVIHEAVGEEENDNYPHHTVIEELQRGFLLFDRVIMPAKVRVSKRSQIKEAVEAGVEEKISVNEQAERKEDVKVNDDKDDYVT